MREETPRPVMLYVENGMFMAKEIVFCKDCKYGSIDVYDNSNVMPIWCEYCDNYRNETDFCSRGERKKPTEF